MKKEKDAEDPYALLGKRVRVDYNRLHKDDQQDEEDAHPAGRIDEYSKKNGYHVSYDDGYAEDLSVTSLMRCCEAVLTEEE